MALQARARAVLIGPPQAALSVRLGTLNETPSSAATPPKRFTRPERTINIQGAPMIRGTERAIHYRVLRRFSMVAGQGILRNATRNKDTSAERREAGRAVGTRPIKP